jgi:hypothetical protein
MLEETEALEPLKGKAMTFETTTRVDRSTAHDTHHTARRLAALGLAAGPVLTITWLAQGIVRDGYDFARHPMSLLALGEGGWVQTVNFLVTGMLVLMTARSLSVSLAEGIGARWAPRLTTVIGVSLVAAGLFPADPGAGFPAGAPQGAPDYTPVGVLHELSHLTIVVTWIVLCVVLRRRFKSLGDRAWARASLWIIPLTLLVVAVPHVDTFPIRIVIASVAQLVFVGAAAKHLADSAR